MKTWDGTKANTEEGRHTGKGLQLLKLTLPNAQVYNSDQIQFYSSQHLSYD